MPKGLNTRYLDCEELEKEYESRLKEIRICREGESANEYTRRCQREEAQCSLHLKPFVSQIEERESEE